MIVTAYSVVLVTLVSATNIDQTQIERYGESSRIKKYQLAVSGRDPITIIEAEPPTEETQTKWIDITLSKPTSNTDVEQKHTLTDIYQEHVSDAPRCYGPSCQEGFIEEEGPQGNFEEYIKEYADKIKDYRDYSGDRLQAISALASKLKNENIKSDRYFAQAYPGEPEQDPEQDNGGKVYTAWNKLKIRKHKHPYDDKDGWVTLEPVAWSTSKISKWKPNIRKQQKPADQWNDDDSSYSNDDGYYQMTDTSPSYPQKKPSVVRPAYINNKLHVSSSNDWDTEVPKPSWNRPQATQSYPPQATQSYPSSWNPDESRRPYKPSCDKSEHAPTDDTVYYGLRDSVVTDTRPSHFPYEYEALKRPLKRPTQVVYAGNPDADIEKTSQSNFGNGQWILLSTTKGYRNKKRQRSLFDSPDHDNKSDPPLTITSHQAVALTVLPADDRNKTMTTSHGGLLEVERSFKTVEESKRDMDKENEYRPDLNAASSNYRPLVNKVFKRKVISSMGSDSSAVLAAVGAGMVPATMAMVVPMMIGKRRKRDTVWISAQNLPYKNNILKY